MKAGFIGAGRVGVTMGAYFQSKGWPVTGYASRNPGSARHAADVTGSIAFDSPEELASASDLLLLTVPDDALPGVWEELKAFWPEGSARKILSHTSGSLTSRVFTDAAALGVLTCSIHPMFSFQHRDGRTQGLDNAFFSIEGDAAALKFIQPRIEALGNRVLVLKPEMKVKYHIASVTASNFVTALMDLACRLMQECGIGEADSLAALGPLAECNLAGVLDKGIARSLTGPVERCDAGTVERQMQALSGRELELYRILSGILVEISQRKHPERNFSGLKDRLNQTGNRSDG